MSWLDRLEKWIRPVVVPNIATYIIGAQFLIYAVSLTQPEIIEKIQLIPAKVFELELWRLITFPLTPPGAHPIFLFFAWYLFYIMASALESQWGVARFNLFLGVGYLATLGATFLTAFVAPYTPASVGFLAGSVFLAFAYLFPNFTIYLFFILPVKVKWLALFTWLSYAFTFLVGGWTAKALVLASVSNYLLFFGRDIVASMRSKKFRMESQAREIQQENQPIHRCTVCGKTDKTHPGSDFRYCSRCAEPLCYCEEHIRNHEHVEA